MSVILVVRVNNKSIIITLIVAMITIKCHLVYGKYLVIIVKKKKAGGVFPYLLVNIGSGVSIVRVDGPNSFHRVSGSFIGGGTFWGLCNLLTKAKTFGEAMELSAQGDFCKIDMLVGDIYGSEGYRAFNLKPEAVACALGKLTIMATPIVVKAASTFSGSESISDGDQEGTLVSEADIAASILHMVGGNIAQLAYINAVQQKITHILFAGNFLRDNLVSSGFLARSIHYWSKGKMKALFLKHEGYFGSLGALLLD